MRILLSLLAALAMAGCVPNNVRQNEAAVFDFGTAAAGWAAPALQRIDVAAPSWLGTPAMQYRLAYDDGARRRTYTDSRWAAPPAELLEQALRRRAVAAGGEAALPCRLRLELDELVQTFDTPQASRLGLAARARLMCHGEQTLAARSFAVEHPAGSDARGGVAAAAAAVQELGKQLAAWVAAEKSAVAARRD
ncbi:ABC-type transport auxiliary lipoprotein family protein [Sulfurisoma sediminicola]|uniref:Cholesterol transport system auxiliary component n=1 Tax=Sulfurisoma sediminicola TaxID=1381557 RepID=A0A497XDV3_9PROT|nr:ABC-type transport auxiliary lipoprotein family protein [Sulfurisoma sediminicola]RLJ65161.1 cholesterol transport system auxiliary component [Sulfurisoma sediminicola]